ncbi:Protein CBG16868 [Caenorhabditis briggsae]|uniref:Protein CBG16868 n=1 Tax=Caenorhabditis briggsae TaxID=6238 RepID=A8XPZ2_CAEBR|nr:Protein CBG16868 [Caenorhabditis briggsae]CAP34718.1 Protein CBG16868 [Caenorhabditis briggsae]
MRYRGSKLTAWGRSIKARLYLLPTHAIVKRMADETVEIQTATSQHVARRSKLDELLQSVANGGATPRSNSWSREQQADMEVHHLTQSARSPRSKASQGYLSYSGRPLFPFFFVARLPIHAVFFLSYSYFLQTTQNNCIHISSFFRSDLQSPENDQNELKNAFFIYLWQVL